MAGYQETYQLLCSVPMDQDAQLPQATTARIRAPPATAILTPTKHLTTKKIITKTAPMTDNLCNKPPADTPCLHEPPRTTPYIAPDTTKITETIYTICCHRPKTWETTTKILKTFIFEPTMDMLNTIELDKSDDIILEEPITTIVTERSTTKRASTSKSTTPETTTKSTTLKTITKPTTPKSTTKPSTTTIVTTEMTSPETVPSTTTIRPITTITSTTTSSATIQDTYYLPIITETETIASTKITKNNTTFTESCQNKTREIPTASSKCCERPGTWETTTENAVEYFVSPSKLEESTTITRTTLRSTSLKSTTMSSIAPKKTVPNLHIDITTTDAPTTENNFDDSDSSFLSEDTKENNIIFSKEEVQTKRTTTKRSTFKSSTKVETTSSARPSSTVRNSEEETETTTSIRRLPLTKKVNFTLKPTMSPYSWWYPSPCKSNRCQRPVTWETTTKRKRKYHGYQ